MSVKKVAVVGVGIVAGEFVWNFVAPMVVGKIVGDSGDAGFGLDDVAHALVVAATVLMVQSFI